MKLIVQVKGKICIKNDFFQFCWIRYSGIKSSIKIYKNFLVLQMIAVRMIVLMKMMSVMRMLMRIIVIIIMTITIVRMIVSVVIVMVTMSRNFIMVMKRRTYNKFCWFHFYQLLLILLF